MGPAPKCPAPKRTDPNNLMGRQQDKTFLKKLVYNHQICTTDLSIAEAFNSYFTNVAQNLQNQLPLFEIDHISYLPNVTSNLFCLLPVDEGRGMPWIYIEFEKYENRCTLGTC